MAIRTEAMRASRCFRIDLLLPPSPIPPSLLFDPAASARAARQREGKLRALQADRRFAGTRRANEMSSLKFTANCDFSAPDKAPRLDTHPDKHAVQGT